MTPSLLQRFIKALHDIDQSGNTQNMLKLFSDQCEISNVAIKPLRGKKGVEQFWKDYSETFQDIETDFTRVSETEGKCFLEWTSKGKLKTGRSIVYEGLTVIEWKNDAIQRFKAYHDSAVFLKEGGKHSDTAAESSKVRAISTSKVMEGGPRRDISTPGEGVLTSTIKDRDAATG